MRRGRIAAGFAGRTTLIRAPLPGSGVVTTGEPCRGTRPCPGRENSPAGQQQFGVSLLIELKGDQ
jgi:hypothetical protein